MDSRSPKSPKLLLLVGVQRISGVMAGGTVHEPFTTATGERRERGTSKGTPGNQELRRATLFARVGTPGESERLHVCRVRGESTHGQVYWRSRQREEEVFCFLFVHRTTVRPSLAFSLVRSL